MIKKSILLLSAIFCLANANAQKCATDEVHAELKKKYPELQAIQDALDMAWRGGSANGKSNSPFFDAWQKSVYDSVIKDKILIPVVVHIVHDYGTEYVSDNTIYQVIKNLNRVYSGANTDLSDVIPPFKEYIGNPNIEFRLAKKDPAGNPTTGINRIKSYLTNGGDDQAKLDLWAPNRYLNIWVIRVIGRSPSSGRILAYATLPSGAAVNPYNDGIIADAAYLLNDDKTIEHEVGHYLNLYHPWNSSGKDVGEECGDDEVDDTPLTKGHFSTCPLYDMHCDTTNGGKYMKSYLYDSLGTVRTAVVDYPDTTNTQNIMDYSNCVRMFTKMQVLRMRAALRNSVGNRDNLTTTTTQIATGIGAPKDVYYVNDLKPVPDFSVEKTALLGGDRSVFMCAVDKEFSLKNQSWRDTISSIEWSISNNATLSTATNAQNVKFRVAEPGWVTTTLKASSNSGDSTISRKEVYAADGKNVINGNTGGFYQEFSNVTENERWPIFNYYDNQFKWEIVNNAGYYDNSSIVYRGYDSRTYPAFYKGAPAHEVVKTNPTRRVKITGDVDDFFTPAFDLSGMQGAPECNLNFMYAGFWRSSDIALLNDSLEIAYSTDCGSTWQNVKILTKTDLMRGTLAIPFAPLSMSDWDLKSISVPNAARTSKVFFRFRYKPICDFSSGVSLGIGNNYYIDRINVSPFPAGINTLVGKGNNIAINPNPTSTNAFVVIRGSQGVLTTVTVTDITGKLVYRTQETLQSNVSRIEVPASVLQSKGMYLVNIVSGTQTKTEKLVVN